MAPALAVARTASKRDRASFQAPERKAASPATSSCVVPIRRDSTRPGRARKSGPGPTRVSSVGADTGRERLDVLRGERVARDAPVAAADLIDDAPRHRTHVLALDLHHRVGETADDLLLLLGGEDVLDDLDLNERHVGLPLFTTPVLGAPRACPRWCRPRFGRDGHFDVRAAVARPGHGDVTASAGRRSSPAGTHCHAARRFASY